MEKNFLIRVLRQKNSVINFLLSLLLKSYIRRGAILIPIFFVF
jgi:hypothetical protein